MNKSSLVALSLGLLAVLSCLDPIVHGQDCCNPVRWPCCVGRLQDSYRSARVKRRTQAMAVESTLLGSFHDATSRRSKPFEVLLQSLTYKPQTLRRKGPKR